MSKQHNDLTLTAGEVARALRTEAYTSPPWSELRKAYYRPKEVGGEEKAKLIMRRWVEEYIQEHNEWVDTYHNGDRDPAAVSTPSWL